MQPLIKLPCEHPVECLKFSPDGSLLLALAYHGEITIWDTVYGQQLPHRMTTGLQDAAIFPNNDFIALATTSERSTLAIHRLPHLEKVTEIEVAGIMSVGVFPDTEMLIVGIPENWKTPYVLRGFVAIYDRQLSVQSKLGLSSYPVTLALSADGRTLAFQHGIHTIWRLSNLTEFECVWEDSIFFQQNRSCETTCVALSSDGKYAALGFWGSPEGAIQGVEVESGETTGWFATEFEQGCSAVAISRTGKFIVGAGQGQASVKVWHRATVSVSHQYEIADCTALAFNAAGDRLAIGSGSEVTLWEFTE